MSMERNTGIVILVFVSALSACVLSACGVRGKPQPPLSPAELGRGQPTFKRATEEFAFPVVPPPEALPRPTPAPTPTPGSRGRRGSPTGP